MPDILDDAHPEPSPASQRRVGWIACALSALLSLSAGLSSIQMAIEFRKPITAPGGGGKDPYWFIDKLMNQIGAPIFFVLALVGCVICWKRRTGGWLAVGALIVGVACWIGAVIAFP